VADCSSELGVESGWVPAAATVVGSHNVLATAEVPVLSVRYNPEALRLS
jgi:hypothetical protein